MCDVRETDRFGENVMSNLSYTEETEVLMRGYGEVLLVLG